MSFGGSTRRFAALCLISGAGLASLHAQSSTVAFPSTGAVTNPSVISGKVVDNNWTVSSGLKEESYNGPAWIVNDDTLPGGWVTPDPGSHWIAPDSDQTNGKRPGNCCQGSVRYSVTFNVGDASNALLHLKFAADEVITAYLNGTDDAHIVYSTDGPTYNSPQTVIIKQGATYVDPGGFSHKVQFVQGTNTMTVEVLNFGGGPTGLYVKSDTDAPVDPNFVDDFSWFDTWSMLGQWEPVDGATGQYFDVFTDLRLGGPLSLAFQRYYGSLLSGKGFTSALGVNWMHNFDVALRTSGSNASVLLFNGKQVKFTGSAGTWKLGSPVSVPYQLLQSASGFAFIDPQQKLRYSFTPGGVLQSIADRNGNTITVTQGANGPTQASWGPYTLTFTYTGKQLTSVRDQSGRQVQFAYTGGLLTSFTDVTQQTTTYSYTSAGKLTGLQTSKKLPLGEVPTMQTYDANGRVTSQTDANNNKSTLAYDGKGGTTITDPKGNVTKQVFDTHGDVAQLSGPTGGTSKFTYDSSFRRTGITDRMGNSVGYTYDPATSKVASRTDPAGNTTKFTYTTQTQNGAAFSLLAGITYGDGTTTSYTYDNQGNLLSATLRDGTTRKNTYDQFGRVTSSTGPNGATSKYTYNADFTAATSEDPLGNKSTYSYDANGRLSKIIDPQGSVASLSYDARGVLTSYTNAYGAVSSSAYDSDGRLSQRTNLYGGTGNYTWNPDGTLSAYTDALGNARQFSYDAMQRLSSFTNALGQTVRYTRDAVGHLLTIADDSGTRMTYTYNSEGRRTSLQDALGRTWSYGLDSFGRRASFTSPLGNKTSFTFDKMGRNSGVTDALGSTTSVQFDAMGRVTGVTLPGGGSMKIVRNSGGQVTSTTDLNGKVWTRDYDALGRVVKRTDPLGNSTTYAYTGTLLSGATTPVGTLSLTNDAAGNITQRKYSDGTTLNYTYDPTGRVATADGVAIQRDTRGQIVGSNGITVSRDPLGRITSLTYAGGKTINYTYDASGKLVQLTDWAGATTNFTYDAAGEMSSMQRANGVTSNYTYDNDGRLITIATGSLASINLTRDAIGRIVSADRNLPLAPTLASGSQTYSYDAASQLTTATYDAAGRNTAQDNRTYSWDGASRLISFTESGSPVTLTYDSLGEMSSMTTSAGTRNFVFNYAIKLPALSIVQQGGSDLRYYVYLPNGKLLYSIEAADNTRHFYHFDEAGNTAFLTDDSGSVTDTYAITPYGEVMNHPGTSDNPFTFQGQDGVLQEAPGLYYMRSRHYDAASARFLSRDSAQTSDPREFAPYSYAASNPMMFRDPLGTDFTWWNPFTWFDSATPDEEPQDPPAPDPATDPAPVPEDPPQPVADPAPYSWEDQSANWDAFAFPTTLSDPGPALSLSVDSNTFAQAVTDFTGGHCCNGNVTVSGTLADGSTISSSINIDTVLDIVSHDGGTLNRQDILDIVSHDGGTLTIQDLSAIVASGAGNLSDDEKSKLIVDVSQIVASGAGNIIHSDGAGIIHSDGAGIIHSDGAGIIHSDGAGIVAAIAGLVASSGFSNLNIGTINAALISAHSGKLLTDNGGAFVSDNGAALSLIPPFGYQ